MHCAGAHLAFRAGTSALLLPAAIRLLVPHRRLLRDPSRGSCPITLTAITLSSKDRKEGNRTLPLELLKLVKECDLFRSEPH